MSGIRNDIPARPRVSVVVPFKGDELAARRLLEAFAAIEVREGDELIAVDNTRAGALVRAAAQSGRVRAVHAIAEASSYYARNVGAEAASGDWILFTDADCRPRSTILDDYFARPVDERCGALGGEVVGAAGQTSLVARFARSRGHLEQSGHLEASVRRFAGTANLLVRRAAWEDVGGFCEGIRTAGDQDFTWRLQERGWTVEYAGDAIVEHLHRERIGQLLEQSLRYGTAIGWLGRRHPGTYARASVLRSLGGAARIVLRAALYDVPRRRPEASFAVLDGLAAGAFALGPLVDNRARRNGADPSPGRVALVDALDPAAIPSGTTHVEASRRPDLPQPWLARQIRTNYSEDDGDLRHALDLLWLAARHPLGTASAIRGGHAVRALRAIAPAARRLSRLVQGHVPWEVDAARADDAALVRRLLGAPEPSLRRSPEESL